MNQLKKFCRIFALMMVLTLVSPSIVPVSSIAVAQAAAINLSKKEITLEVGKSQTLKITGTKQKVTWSSGKKTVATVSSTGKVTAKGVGTTVITAAVNKKKYTCKVTVTAAKVVNPKVTNAPFAAQEEKYNKVTYIIPKDWTNDSAYQQGSTTIFTIHPVVDKKITTYSNMSLNITETGVPKADYNLIKEVLSEKVTEDYMKQQLAQSSPDAVMSDFKQSDYVSTLGTAFKTDYTVTYNGNTIKQSIYDLSIDDYLFEVIVTDTGDGVTPDVTTAGEYLLNTISVGK
ncbi:Ig-like domain-containing protein [Anaerocolumna sp. AGMB13025]|uniref:Ig-like domain-containing protein n=1 Tax=Anaerocolumna sp. AGMB13025 TaxID=3039116 RepID=UPI00241F0C92|nr:Ig-like domain-containing protein [Anaerocolumna sp. AGMB13025]WFR56643.1 Ig-like domain-containing protein [Anaerocolumna sp. AGMB13025]